MPHELVGKQLGEYKIQSEIGRGRHSVVYEAHDTVHDRPVVLKVWSGLSMDNSGVRKRFETSAQLLTELDHPNIIKVYDYSVVEDDSLVYLVMPFLGGGTLEEHLTEPWPVEDAVRTAAEISRALEHAHQQDLVHGDVRPGNIMFTEGGWPLITDFGIIALYDDESDADVWAYFSPERLENGGEPNASTDLYAVGVLLYELISGQHPFPSTDQSELIPQQTSGPEPLRRKRGDVPRSIDEVIDKALDPDPSLRWETGGELARALIDALPSDGRRSRSSSRPRTPPAGLQAFQRDNGDARDKVRATFDKVGAVLWRATKWIFGKVVAAVVILLLVCLALLIGGTFLLGNVIEERLAEQRWYFGDWADGGKTVVREEHVEDPLQETVEWYAPGAITDVRADFSTPDIVRFRGWVQNRSVELKIRLHTTNGVPQVRIERLNDVPLYLIGGILSDKINAGLRRSWTEAPVRVTRLLVVGDEIRATLEP